MTGISLVGVYPGVTRYPDGGGLTAMQRAQREQVRFRGAELFASQHQPRQLNGFIADIGVGPTMTSPHTDDLSSWCSHPGGLPHTAREHRARERDRRGLPAPGGENDHW